MPAFTERTGQQFGRLTVVALSGRRLSSVYWRCLCACGNETIVAGSQLTGGKTQSCGCLRSDRAREAHLTHGRSPRSGPQREYRSWHAMKQRCYYKQHVRYADYGGRGITVCPEWRDSFADFLRDVGACPPGHSLDRWPDRNGNYEPGNVRWATGREQANNQRSNRVIEVRGERMTLADAARRFGISYNRLRLRVRRGIAPDLAVLA